MEEIYYDLNGNRISSKITRRVIRNYGEKPVEQYYDE